MPYIPNTNDDRRQMLKKIGVADIDELFKNIPPDLRLNKPLDIPAMSEMEVLGEIEAMSRQNRNDLVCFAGSRQRSMQSSVGLSL